MSALRICLVVSVLWGVAGPAWGAPPVQRVVSAEVTGADSLRAHSFALIARGQITEAIDYWVLTTGKEAPKWLWGLKTAFDAGNQRAGPCQEVARAVSTAFSKLGGTPELVELRTRSVEEVPYIMFKMANGQDLNVTRTGFHVLVRMDGRAYDAFTGPAGMSWAEYLSRLGALSEITQKVVDAVTEVP